MHCMCCCPVQLASTPVSLRVCSGVGGDFPFNRIHQGGGTFLSAEVRAIAQRVRCCRQEMERKNHCCYRGQKCAGVARGAQVDNDVTGPSL